jgi:putative folate metabolism gamma-glutamate ligase
MKIKSIKTHKITTEDKNILDVVDKYVTELKEGSMVAVTSKVIAICEGRVVKVESGDKDKLIKQEAQYFIPRHKNKYHVALTVTNNLLTASAGIDESNGNGYYILWPENSFESANKIRAFLRKKFGLKNLGVIITDSKTMPLKWGVTGTAIGYSGFKSLNDLIGTEDIFGRPLVMTKVNIAENLAAAATLLMGEGSEQMPIAIAEELPFVEFVDNDPTQEEIKSLKIKIEDDIYEPFLNSAKWEKGDQYDG